MISQLMTVVQPSPYVQIGWLVLSAVILFLLVWFDDRTGGPNDSDCMY